MPDYPLDLTYNEAVSGADGETDVMLEHALSLIAEGRYLSHEDPFSEADKTPSESYRASSILIGIGVLIMLALLLAFIVRRRTNRDK